MAIIGKDILSEHFLSRILSCMAYFGSLDEEYGENYEDNEYTWSYGDGEIMVCFLDFLGKDWRIEFKKRDDSL